MWFLALTADEYAQNLSAISRYTSACHRYPGSNYERLAQSLLPSPRRVSSNPRPEYTKSEFAFVHTIRNFGRDIPIHDREINAHNIQQPSDPQNLDKEAKLVFLRGQASSEWLRHLGAAYHIDPEFYQRHLDFLATAGRANHYVLPSIPSASDSIIQLSYFTISNFSALKDMLDVQAKDTGSQTIDELRRSAQQQMESYLTNVTQRIDSRDGIGDSIVRNFHVFDSLHFALEQRMTLTVTTAGDGDEWTGQ